MPKTTVVNKRKEKFDVYIGRPSKWGNPYQIGPDGSRAEVIEAFHRFILKRPKLLYALKDLRGKKLGCYCAPKPCHGDVLARLADLPCVPCDCSGICPLAFDLEVVDPNCNMDFEDDDIG